MRDWLAQDRFGVVIGQAKINFAVVLALLLGNRNWLEELSI
jgi:hypothetical protein